VFDYYTIEKFGELKRAEALEEARIDLLWNSRNGRRARRPSTSQQIAIVLQQAVRLMLPWKLGGQHK
jgi:hypothetical protein